MITIDGSEGEGGGQMLRTSLALSLVTGESLHVVNARAKRDKPGLRPQHLTAVRAAAAVGRAEVRGAAVGSRELFFTPHGIHGGAHTFAVGTAGSATLVLQTVLPALLFAREPSDVIVEGGTHNPKAPPWDFLDRAFFPLLARMGIEVRGRLERAGFYPKGGGRLRVSIHPYRRTNGTFELMDRGEVRAVHATAAVAGLPKGIAARELDSIAAQLPAARRRALELDPSWGPGNYLTIDLESEHVTEVVSGVGERGLRADIVAARALDEANRLVASGAPVGEHLADQLLLPLALTTGGRFRTVAPTLHARTQVEVMQRFLGPCVTFTDEHVATVTYIGPSKSA